MVTAAEMLEFQAGILSAIQDSVTVVSCEGILLYTNAAFDTMFGYTSGELLGQPVTLLNAETVRPAGETAGEIMTELLGRGVWSGEVLNRRKDGSTFWTSAKITTQVTPQWGTVWISVQRDITRQHAQQAALQASEWRYRTLVEATSTVTWSCPPDGLHVVAQPAWMAFTGQGAEEMLGAGWADAVHPDDVARAAEQWQGAVEREEVFVHEHRVRRHDGAWRWMKVRAVPVRDAQGVLIEWMGMGHDVTEQMATEQTLKDNEERLDLALMAAGMVLWDWDIPLQQVYAGHRWFEMLGYSREELSSREGDWRALIHPEDRAAFDRVMTACLEGEAEFLHSEHRLRHQSGRWLAVEALGKVTCRDREGRPLRMVGTVHDISGRKRLNEEGVGLLKRIEQMIREVSSGAHTGVDAAGATESLTRRQRQILALIADGMTSAAIAKKLGISVGTAISHRRELMKKLDLHSAAEVTRFAINHRLTNA